MEKFAGYGFNKSHAAAYALVAYQTAYMKAHHPAAFMAANMSAMMGDTDKVKQFCEDSAANGLKVLRPELAAVIGAERFLREIGIAARLSHPHIVPLIDSGEANGMLYYVQPFIPGGSLRERLRKKTVDNAVAEGRPGS